MRNRRIAGLRSRFWQFAVCYKLVSAPLCVARIAVVAIRGRHYILKTKFGSANIIEGAMVRPASKELTERELEVMHVFWQVGESTANEAREVLAKSGIDRAYVTVANLVRLLVDKGFLQPINDKRPFRYRPIRSFEEVSRSLVGDLVQRVFGGSLGMLLVQAMGEKKQLTAEERACLEQILREQDDE